LIHLNLGGYWLIIKTDVESIACGWVLTGLVWLRIGTSELLRKLKLTFGFQKRQGKKICTIFKAVRPALGPTQPINSMGNVGSFPEIKSAEICSIPPISI
jgi:hypothetical protein